MALPKKHETKIKPLKTILYGESGVGKTTFATSAPNCVVIPTEDGLSRIENEFDAFELVTTIEEFNDCLQELKDNKSLKYKTLVVDSLNWLEALVQNSVCEKFNADIIAKADGGFGRGEDQCVEKLKKIIQRLDYLKNNLSMNIVLISHFRKVNEVDLTVGTEKFNKYELDLSPKANKLFVEWADNVLFAARKHGNNAKEIKLKNGEKLENPSAIFGNGTRTYFAKNRIGLPDVIPLKYQVYERYALGRSEDEKIEN